MQTGARSRRILCLALALLYGTPLFAQRELMTFGVKVGMPISPSFSNLDNGIPTPTTQSNYYSPILGLSFETALSPRFAVEANALFNREKFDFHQPRSCSKSGCSYPEVNWDTHGHNLEFPVVLKTYLNAKHQSRGFASIGVSWSRMTLSSWSTFCERPEVHIASCTGTHGFFGLAAGGGVDIRKGSFHFYPELRYTRWINGNYPDENVDFLHRNEDAFRILFGISYGR